MPEVSLYTAKNEDASIGSIYIDRDDAAIYVSTGCGTWAPLEHAETDRAEQCAYCGGTGDPDDAGSCAGCGAPRMSG